MNHKSEEGVEDPKKQLCNKIARVMKLWKWVAESKTDGCIQGNVFSGEFKAK